MDNLSINSRNPCYGTPLISMHFIYFYLRFSQLRSNDAKLDAAHVVFEV